jgi:NTE family protein
MQDVLMSTNFSDFLDAPWSKTWALWHDFGIYRGRKLYEWVYTLLKKRDVEIFGDTRRDLVVIASNLTNKEVLVFDKAKYANVSIAEAVRMSSGIPLFFSAHRWGNSLIVDGGLLSNYPFWAFANSQLPTFGFKLVSDASKKIPEPPTSLPAYLSSLLSTMLDAHDKKDVQAMGADRTVHIPTGDVATTNFSLTQDEKRSLYNAGYVAASQFILQKQPFRSAPAVSAQVPHGMKHKDEKELFAESADRLRNVAPDLMERAFRPIEVRRSIIVEPPAAFSMTEEDLINELEHDQDHVLRRIVSDAPMNPKDLQLRGEVTIDGKKSDAALTAHPEDASNHVFRVRVGFNGPVVAQGKAVKLTWSCRFPTAVALNEDYWVFPVNHFRYPVPVIAIKATFPRNPVDKSFFAASEEDLRPVPLTGPSLSENSKGGSLYTYEARVEHAKGFYVLRWRFE